MTLANRQAHWQVTQSTLDQNQPKSLPIPNAPASGKTRKPNRVDGRRP